MRIQSIKCLAFAIPNQPYIVGKDSGPAEPSRGRYRSHPHYRAIYSPNAESMLVIIEADNGLVGYGEAQACIAPDIVNALIETLLIPTLIGADPRHPAVLRDKMYDLMRERGHDGGYLSDAIAACDIALWDLAAKAANVPLYQMLGGAFHSSLPCYVSGVPAPTLDAQLEKIAGWIEKGFHRFKLSLAPTIEDHVDTVSRIRGEFGDRVQLLIDAHWAFTVHQAIQLDRALSPYNIYWIECPLTPENAANQALLPQRFHSAHAAGEEYRTRYHFLDRLSRHAIDIAQPDIGRTGITEGSRIAALCMAHDVPVAYHIGAGLGVYTAATLHIAAATPNLDLMEFQPSQINAANPYFSPSNQPENGAYSLPQGPGIGITADVQALEKLKL